MNILSKKYNIPLNLIAIFILFSVAVTIAGYIYVDKQSTEQKTIQERELAAIADLKVGQIVNWHREREGDGAVTLQNPFLIRSVKHFLKNPASRDKKEEVLVPMRLLREKFKYRNVILLDAEMKTRLWLNDEDKHVGEIALEAAGKSVQSGKIVFSDFHRGEMKSDIHLDLLVPLLMRNDVIGVFLMRIDPVDFLYPLIQSWPTPSPTAESLLIGTNDDNIVFLNEVRHRKDTALTLRYPITEAQLPAAMAARGVEGIAEGIDYRGVHVLAAIKAVPGFPWHLVCKVDKEEVDAPIRSRTWMMFVLVCALIAAAGAGVGFVWRSQRADFYRKLYDDEVEREALLKHHEYLTKYANDIILLIDQNRKIVMANDRAVQAYGYSLEELLQMDMKELESPELAIEIEELGKKIDESNGIVFERIHRRKDGTCFPVEASVRVIEVDGNKYYQAIHRNITERKMAEAVHKLDEARLESLLRISQYDSESIQNLLDFALDEAISLTESKIGYIYFYNDEEKEFILNTWSKDVMKECTIAEPQTVYQLDKTGIWGEAVRQAKPIVVNDFQAPHPLKKGYPEGHAPLYKYLTIPVFGSDRIVAVVGVANKADDYDESDIRQLTLMMDAVWKIASKKQAEEQQKESEARYRTLFDNANDAIFILRDDTFIDCNVVTMKMFGCSREQIVGKFPYVFSPHFQPDGRDSKEKAKEKIHKAIAGEPQFFEWKHCRYDGTPFDAEVSLNSVKIGDEVLIQSLVRDITERKQAEEKVRSAKTFLDMVIDMSPFAMWISDKEGTVIRVNRSLCDTINLTEDKIIGKYNVLKDVNLEIHGVMTVVKAVFEKHEPAHFSIPWQAADAGDVDFKGACDMHIDVSMFPILNAQSELTHVVCQWVDITERKKAEEKVKESEKRLSTIIDFLPDATFAIDREGKVIAWNRAMEKMSGINAEDILGKGNYEYSLPFYGKRIPILIDLVFDYDETNVKKYHFIRKEGDVLLAEGRVPVRGEERELWGKAAPLYDASGNMVGAIESIRDVTEHREAEKLYKALAESSLAAVFIVQNGKTRFINTSAIRYAGYSAEELIGQDSDMIVHPEDRDMVKKKGREMLKGGYPSPYEYRMVAKDGQIKWIMQIVSPIQIEGKPAILGNAIDITMRKQMEEEGIRSFERLRKALGAIIQAMAVTVETRDPYTAGHQRRVSDLARAIATEMGLSKEQIDGIRLASVIHDIGKIAVPVEILSKPTKLTDIEFSLIKIHAQAGYDILKDIEFPWPIARMVLEHHEKINGSGYPNGRTGENLLMESRILTVADVVEAIASHRPYRPGLGIESALNEITKNRGILYETDVVDACLRLFNEKRFSFADRS